MNGLSSEFDCFYRDKFVGRFHLALGGAHNISNALAVIALGLELGIDSKHIKNTLTNYKGASRRMEVKFKDGDYLLIDDYAHHPSEIRATLAAASHLKRKRVIAVFQPHRYSRTKLLLDEFSKSFTQADYVVITDIYPASEPALEGVHARNIVEKIKDKQALYLSKEKIAAHILEIRRPGDLVITLGAGDITKISDELAKRFSCF